MLGWAFRIQLLSNKLLPEHDSYKTAAFAEWDSSMFGTKWIEDLVREGKADKVLKHGYPNSYLLRAGILLEVMRKGIPDHKGVTVVGDDYVMPGDWKGNARVNLAALASFDPNEFVIVDAWDLS